MISFEQLNELYNLLDLYLVTSRYEGDHRPFLIPITKNVLHHEVSIAKEIMYMKNQLSISIIICIQTLIMHFLTYRII